MNEQIWVTFKTVAEIGTLSQAARSLNLSQSAVTQQVQQLEQNYDCALLVRSSHGVHLTEAGEIVYRYINDLLRLSHESHEAVHTLKAVRPITLRIGASLTVAEYVLPEILKKYCQQAHNVGITVLMANSRSVFDQVLHQECDVGIIETAFHHPQVTVQPFFADRPQVVVGNSHRWFNRREISLEEFLTEPLIIREPGSGTRLALEEALKAIHIDLQQVSIRLVLATTQAIKEMVKQGFGVSVLSPLIISPEEHESFRVLEVRGLNVFRNFSVISHRDAIPPHIEKFTQLVLKSAPDISDKLHWLSSC